MRQSCLQPLRSQPERKEEEEEEGWGKDQDNGEKIHNEALYPCTRRVLDKQNGWKRQPGSGGGQAVVVFYYTHHRWDDKDVAP